MNFNVRTQFLNCQILKVHWGHVSKYTFQLWWHFPFAVVGLETLPTELQRNFNLMRDLDQRTQGIVPQRLKQTNHRKFTIQYEGDCLILLSGWSTHENKSINYFATFYTAHMYNNLYIVNRNMRFCSKLKINLKEV